MVAPLIAYQAPRLPALTVEFFDPYARAICKGHMAAVGGFWSFMRACA
jgi:hypothetical protein